jgi:hypothetical protein
MKLKRVQVALALGVFLTGVGHAADESAPSGTLEEVVV